MAYNVRNLSEQLEDRMGGRHQGCLRAEQGGYFGAIVADSRCEEDDLGIQGG